jgi:hypothetical protein
MGIKGKMWFILLNIMLQIYSVQHSSVPGLENREYGLRDPSRSPRDTLYPQKVGLNFVD